MSHDLAASFWANLLTFGHGLMSLEAGHSIWCVYFLWFFFFRDYLKVTSVVIHHFCIYCGGFIFNFIIYVDDKFQDLVLGWSASDEDLILLIMYNYYCEACR